MLKAAGPFVNAAGERPAGRLRGDGQGRGPLGERGGGG
jgi:hypothetical protein